MGESLKIIRFNDDNHAERIWINGRFVGTTANLDEVFEEFLKISQEKLGLEQKVQQYGLVMILKNLKKIKNG